MNILVIGDSLTEGYVTKETPRYYPYSTELRKMNGIRKVKNIGLSGQTTYTILHNLKKQKINNFDTTIILSGTNDLVHKTHQYIFDINKKLHLHCLQNGVNHVYVLSLPQITSIQTNKPIQEKKRLKLNKLLKDWCNLSGNITYIPFGEFFLYAPRQTKNTPNIKPSNWAHNGYHLSKQGYVKMAHFIYKFLDLRGFKG
jgi:lysophospholipase L1-like esterase